MDETKPWYTSKTLWFNLVSGIVLLVKSKYPQFVVPDDVFAAIILLVNFVLRLVTKKGIEIN